MRHSLTIFTLSLVICGCSLLTASEVEPGFTNQGSDSGFVFPREEGVDLTSKIEHLRLAWKNPIHTGIIKGGSGTVAGLLQDGIDPAYGESATPLLSNGVLLVSWSQPSGEVSGRLDSFSQRYFSNEDRNKAIQSTYLRIDADWHTVAIDADSGETLWHQIEPSASLNFVSAKRGHNGITGATGNGLYITMSILGNVYAYDIASGERRWSTTIDQWHSRAQAFKDEALAQRNMPQVGDAPFGHKRSGAIIADGVAVIPDLSGGLVGLQLDDGSQIWHTPAIIDDTASPRSWIHDGKTWLVCNGSNQGDRAIHLLDPLTGTKQWTHPTGNNPGQLLMGEGYLLLNTKKSVKKSVLVTAYRLGIDGLSKLWTFTDIKAHGLKLGPDFGAHRKGVIHQDVLYLRAGKGTVAIDMNTGKELHRVEESGSLPFIAEDMMYMQANASHSGRKAGLRLFQLEGDGRFSYLGEAAYQGFDFKQVTDYEHPLETPYGGGKIYMRGHQAIAALDLRVIDSPMAELQLGQMWAGFPEPLKALFFTGEDGQQLTASRLQPPAREQLGIVATSAYRKETWTSIVLKESVPFAKAFTSEAEIGMVQFSVNGTLTMEDADGDQWNGTWSRHFPGWDETVTFEGTVHDSSEGGYNRRGWPTGWLKDQPVTFFSDLPEGQERVVLQLHGFIPQSDSARKNMTLCLDHDGERVVGGVGGGFSFNQSYHEIDTSDLVVTENGISGTAIVIINSDPWVAGDYQKGGSLAGRLTLDIQFAEPNDQGIYKARGDWSAEWGIELTRSGPIRGTITNK